MPGAPQTTHPYGARRHGQRAAGKGGGWMPRLQHRPSRTASNQRANVRERARPNRRECITTSTRAGAAASPNSEHARRAVMPARSAVGQIATEIAFTSYATCIGDTLVAACTPASATLVEARQHFRITEPVARTLPLVRFGLRRARHRRQVLPPSSRSTARPPVPISSPHPDSSHAFGRRHRTISAFHDIGACRVRQLPRRLDEARGVFFRSVLRQLVCVCLCAIAERILSLRQSSGRHSMS